ncbi:DUF2177 family protein [Mycoplasmatota bacterium WC30]
MKYLKMYIIALVIFIVIDAVWLGLVAPQFYSDQIGHLMAEEANLFAALVFYLIFVVGVVYFVVNPAVENQNMKQLLVSGILFGFITYATYDLTNLATLKDWPITVTIVDLIWGTTLSTLIGLFTYLIYNKFTSKERSNKS